MKNLVLAALLLLPASAFAANSSTLICFQVPGQTGSVDLFNAKEIHYQVFDTATKNEVLDLSLDRLSQDPGEFNQMEVSYGVGGIDTLDVIFTLNAKSGKYEAGSLETQVPTVNLNDNPTESAARNAACFNLISQ